MTDRIDGGRRVAPAEGERRALRNLSAQYRVAALLVRDALLAGELEWVRLVDPEAGRLDDVVIGRPGRIDAYQIKWSDYRGAITFRYLVTETKVSGQPYPAPFKLLADGWQRLGQANLGRVVRAHFLTYDAPSSHDVTKSVGEGEPSHLQGFLRNAWPKRASWHADGSEDLRSAWRAKIDAIANSTSLAGAELDHFLSHCELDLSFDLERPGSDAGLIDEEVRKIAGFLMDQVASGSGAVHIALPELLRGLGWTDRFELGFKHDFPVDERLYRPVEETVGAISDAIARLDRGYVALVGPPGSGKSTTLTHTLRYANGIRLLRYYAFVRDDRRLGRGEAAAFLHDLCLSLESLVPGNSRRSVENDDLAALQLRIATLFAALSADWKKSGVKSVILIDGLDHIEREQSPVRSLVHELPHPSAIPEGLVIVLGTQRVGLESDITALRPIRAELDRDGRTIEMGRLSRAAIRSIVEAAVGHNLEADEHERVEELSAGHPLALTYLVRRLAAAPAPSNLADILNAANPYSGDIEAEYGTYWETLREEPEVRDLLGLIARLRGPVDLVTVEALASGRPLERFAKTAQHYFHQDTAVSWRFFHNSFRQYVLSMTGRNALGRPDQTASVAFHRRLAEAGAAADSNGPLAWERIYHLERAGEHATLVALDHQPLFRAQFLAGRPEWEVEEDIFRCMRLAATVGDAMTVLGLLLAHKELGDRTSSLESVDLTAMELQLRLPNDRTTALVSGGNLLVSDRVALKWAARLLKEGEAVLAHRVFDLAEPLDLLSGTRRVPGAGKDEDLDAWAISAWRFRPLASIVAAVRQVRVDVKAPDIAPPYEKQSQADHVARRRILEKLALALLSAREEGLLRELEGILAGSREAEGLAFRVDAARVRRGVEEPEFRGEGADALARLLKLADADGVGPEEAARIADLICRLGVEPERADAYLAKVEHSLLSDSLNDRDHEALAGLETLFRQARARAARGRPFDLVEAVPAPTREHEMGRILFQRVVIRIGNVWGEAICGDALPATEVLHRLRPVIRFYRRRFGDTNRWLDWHYAQRASGRLFELMLQAARAHGTEAFDAVLQATLEDWTSHKHNVTGWTLEARRGIALTAYRIDGDKKRTARILANLDTEVEIDHEIYDRVELWRASADAWLAIGNPTPARRARDAMLATSFGLYSDRDAQIDDWAKIAAEAIRGGLEPGRREETARLILTILPVLHRNHRGGGREEAVRAILFALSGLEPSAALASADWLIEQNGAFRADVLSGLVLGQLEGGDPDVLADALALVARLILPFDHNPSAELGAAVLAVAEGSYAGHARVAAALEVLRRTVMTRLQRPNFLERLVCIEAKEEREPRYSTENIKKGTLTLADGSVLTQEQLENLSVRPSALLAALSGSTASNIAWEPVLAALPSTIDRASLSAVGRHFLAVEAGPGVMRELVQRASGLGDTKLVEDATAAAIATSRPYGWLRQYDGGSRIMAAECLVIGDAVHGRTRALQLLVEDHADRALPIRDLLSGIERILPLFSGSFDPRDVWAQVEQHVAAVAEATENTVRAPDFTEAPAIGDGELCALLALRDIDHPANAVSVEARKAVLARLQSDDPGGIALTGLEHALAADLSRRTAALATLTCLAWSHPQLVGRLGDRVRAMAWDSHGIVRRLAQQILLDLGEDLPDPPTRRDLPPIYRLHLPEAPMRKRSLRGSGVEAGEPLPDTDDSIDLSRLFHGSLESIEQTCVRPFTLLARRFAQIMHTLAPAETWSAAAERKLTGHLEAVGLKVTVRRPRSHIAHQAFGVLLAELCDAEELSWPPLEFDAQLLITDPCIDTRDPDPKPDWIPVPTGEALGAYPRDKWLEGVAEALPTLRSAPDGRVVLAEFTTAVSLDGDREEESRVAMLAHHQMTLRKRMPGFDSLLQDSDFVGREYPMLYGGSPLPVAAIAGGPMFTDADFLALNPTLGFHLGWSVSDDGLFRWVDESGAIMVESLWWQDGNLVVNDRAGINQAAYSGWLVLATPAAWKRMRPSIANFLVQRAAGRSAPERGLEEGLNSVLVDAVDLPL
ncbi:MAG TPA: ATP-binding protein [Allosphingosinicella sp.]|jgi:hypothetical protein